MLKTADLIHEHPTVGWAASSCQAHAAVKAPSSDIVALSPSSQSTSPPSMFGMPPSLCRACRTALCLKRPRWRTQPWRFMPQQGLPHGQCICGKSSGGQADSQMPPLPSQSRLNLSQAPQTQSMLLHRCLIVKMRRSWENSSCSAALACIGSAGSPTLPEASSCG